MFKKFINTLFFSAVLFSTQALVAEVDITEMLTEADFAILDEHESVVLLIPDVKKALAFVNAPQNSDLYQLKSAIKQGMNVAPYNKTLSAVEQALSLIVDTHNPEFISLNEYKTMLLKGDATLFIKDEMSYRNKGKSKKFCRICVNTLRADCANICNLTAGTITAGGITFAAPCNTTNAQTVLNIPNSLAVCGNIQFNTVSGTTPPNHLLSAQGAWESKLDILRGVIGFNATSGLTLSLNNLGSSPVDSNAFSVNGFFDTVSPTLISGAPAQFFFDSGTNDIAINANLAKFSMEGVLGLTTHIDFGLTFNNIPTVELTPTINDLNDLINVTTEPNPTITGSVSLAEFTVAAQNVTTTGFDLLILLFPISHEFSNPTQINAAIGGPGDNLLINFFNSLLINILVDGQVS